jgi:hypothetical protein
MSSETKRNLNELPVLNDTGVFIINYCVLEGRAVRGHFLFELVFLVIFQNFGELINSPDLWGHFEGIQPI